MTSTPPLSDILAHTPPWVWGLLAGLIVLGLLQTRQRQVGLARAALLPVAMLGWSLWSVVAGFGSALALAAWALGALSTGVAFARLAPPAGARWRAATRSIDLPGSWAPLGLILALFAVKFGTGVGLALHPALRGEAAFATGASLVFGAFSGVFAGRAAALLRLAERPRRHAVAG